MFDGCIPPEVSPQAGLLSAITVDGEAVMVIPPGAYGGFIWNPVTNAEQNIPTAEEIYVDPIAAPGLMGFGTTTTIYPGGSFVVPVARSTYGIWVNAATGGHRFTVVYWMGP